MSTADLDGSFVNPSPTSLSRDQVATLFGQTMVLVALTSGLFALGAYVGRDSTGGWALLWFLAAFAVLLWMNRIVRRGEQSAVGLLCTFGVLLGLAVAPTIGYYLSANPDAVWAAGAATGLFMAGFGAAGYATRRDLDVFERTLLWALVGLIGFGVVLVFVQIPGGSLIYSLLGLAIFAGLTMLDFQRLRRANDIREAPLLAASIFLDALNVFLFFLSILSGNE
jgi:FtsH-binding integral membrane protein